MTNTTEDLFLSILSKNGHELSPENVFVICDVNEKSDVPRLISTFENCITINHPLNFGDYLVSSRMGIELKRDGDFAQSTVYANVDHNLWKQMRGLSETVIYPNLIIQNISRSKYIARKRMKQLLGSLESFGFKYPIHHTKNDLETAKLIYNMAKREQRKRSKGFSRSVSKKMNIQEKQEYLIQGLIDTGEKKAKLLLNAFGNPINVFRNIELSNLKAKNDKGEKYEFVPSIPEGFKAYNFEWESIKKEDLKGIGLKWILKNKELIGTYTK